MDLSYLGAGLILAGAIFQSNKKGLHRPALAFVIVGVLMVLVSFFKLLG